MNDKQYLNETILQMILKKLEELKQQSQLVINEAILQSLLDEVQQQA